jgi:hypothetical protein
MMVPSNAGHVAMTKATLITSPVDPRQTRVGDVEVEQEEVLMIDGLVVASAARTVVPEASTTEGAEEDTMTEVAREDTMTEVAREDTMIEADLEVVRTKEVDLEVDRMTEVGLVEAVPTIGVVADSEVVPMIAAVIASQHAPITVAVS